MILKFNRKNKSFRRTFVFLLILVKSSCALVTTAEGQPIPGCLSAAFAVNSMQLCYQGYVPSSSLSCWIRVPLPATDIFPT